MMPSPVSQSPDSADVEAAAIGCCPLGSERARSSDYVFPPHTRSSRCDSSATAGCKPRWRLGQELTAGERRSEARKPVRSGAGRSTTQRRSRHRIAGGFHRHHGPRRRHRKPPQDIAIPLLLRLLFETTQVKSSRVCPLLVC